MLPSASSLQPRRGTRLLEVSIFGFDSFRNNAVPNCFSHRPRARCGVVQRAGTQTVFEPINGPPYGHGSLAALVRAYPVPWQFEIGGRRSERTPLLQYISSPDSFCAATLPAAFGQLPPRPPWQIQA